MDAGMRYFLPLQENTVNAEPEFYEDPDDNKFDGVFTYKKRPIWYRKRSSGNRGDFIYTYQDDLRRNEPRGNYVGNSEKECGETEHAPMDVLKKTDLFADKEVEEGNEKIKGCFYSDNFDDFVCDDTEYLCQRCGCYR